MLLKKKWLEESRTKLIKDTDDKTEAIYFWELNKAFSKNHKF